MTARGTDAGAPSPKDPTTPASAARAPAVEKVRIDVLGPLVVTAWVGGKRRVVDVDWRTAEAAVLRELAANPRGASRTKIVDRTGHKKAYDAVSDVRRALQKSGLTVSSHPGSRGYRLIAADASELVIESDLHEFRRRAEEVLDAERDAHMRAKDSGTSLAVQDLRALDDQVTSAVSLWRTSDADDRVAALQSDPASKAASADLNRDVELRLARARLKLGLARSFGTEVHVSDAADAIQDLHQVARALARRRIPFMGDGELRHLVEELRGLRVSLASEQDARTSTESEVFLSAPMASTTDYDPVRELAVRVAEAMREYCGVTNVYCAAETITSSDDFEEPSISLQRNIEPFRAARAFAMVLPGRLYSSVLVEAGMALAFGMPSVYFVRRREDLPWMLRDVSGAGVARIGTVRIIEYEDLHDLLRKVKVAGQRLFPPRADAEIEVKIKGN